MACCGQGRAALRSPAVIMSSRIADKGMIPGGMAAETFEYTGQTSLAVTGTGTGFQYRFPAPGARITVDPRDTRSLLSTPNLRLIRRG